MNDLERDIANMETVDLKTAAKILGLKYHAARKLLYASKSIGVINYGCKKLFILEDVLNYKRKCYIKPENEEE